MRLRLLSLVGMSVAEALDTLVKLDSRYRWTETDGVVGVTAASISPPATLSPR